jgi:hypothetical protein
MRQDCCQNFRGSGQLFRSMNLHFGQANGLWRGSHITSDGARETFGGLLALEGSSSTSYCDENDDP